MRSATAVLALSGALFALASPASARVTRLDFDGGSVEVTIRADDEQRQAMLIEWVRAGAQAVAQYYGHLPVAQVDVDVRDVDGDGISGTTYEGRWIVLRVGRDVTARELRADWTATHEMFHLGFPDLDESHHWMNEGLSDYLEPLARARIGAAEATDVWREFVHGMPKGLPAQGEQGLDHTPTWAATYWGGALFWLVADVRIREATSSARSLDDAVRAILAEGGDGSQHWSIAHVLEVGDAATGTTVLHQLYERMGRQRFEPDLGALWARLGVVETEGRIDLDDSAPSAELRRQMTSAATGRRDRNP